MEHNIIEIIEDAFKNNDLNSIEKYLTPNECYISLMRATLNKLFYIKNYDLLYKIALNSNVMNMSYEFGTYYDRLVFEQPKYYIEFINKINKKLVLIRLNEPTTIQENGTLMWIKNNKFHRTDGPAIKYTDGPEGWYYNGLLHRTDGPAVIGNNGHTAWYLHGKRHRTNGPAIEYSNGNIHKEWYLHDKRHRIDGPAIEWANGDMSWYINGILHRTDGPAIEHIDGFKAWWLNGKHHRIDGPATEHANGDKEWWINDRKYTEEEFNNIVIKEYLKKIPNGYKITIISNIYIISAIDL